MNRTLVVCSVLIAAVFCLQGCASLGSRSELYDKGATSRIQSVVIWPIVIRPDYDGPLNESGTAESPYTYSQMDSVTCGYRQSLILAMRAAEEMQSKMHVRKLSGARHLASHFIGVLPDTNAYQFAAATEVGADAMLIGLVEVKGGWSGDDSYIKLWLYDTHTHDLVASSTFNTRWGSSYLFKPDRSETMEDAVRGAVRAMLSKFKRTMG